jgi:CubicO group peptidase (beta-lactamase class C family)
MTSGLRWNESGISYADPRNSETAMDAAADRYRHVLSRPIDAAPGTRWNYSSGDVAVIAAVIARATRTPIEIFAYEKLFRPLGIGEWDWLKDDKGVPIAASGLRLTPHDMAKLGQLVLARGQWRGEQVVPAAWIDTATSDHATTSGLPADGCALSYGYFFWLGPRCEPGFIAAMGLGGQRIYVSRAHDAVIVITAGLYNGPVLAPFAQEVHRQEIYRAVIAALPPS